MTEMSAMTDPTAECPFLVDRFPELVAEWADTNTLDLATIRWQSNRKVEWVCAQDHRWTAAVQARINLPTRSARSCPMCRVARRSLSVMHPDIAAQWHPDNDGSPTEVSCSSRREALWACAAGHVWVAKINTRTSMKTGCPYCAPNGRVLRGVNDFVSLFPELAQEWDSTKNELSAHEVRPSSMKSVWWLCRIRHSYEATVDARSRRGDGCPYCAGRRVLAGFNDLATVRPALVGEWSPRNGLDPTEVTVSSEYSAEWVCSEGHRWTCRVSGRTSRLPATRCPRCWHSRQSIIELRFWDALRDEHSFEVEIGAPTPVKWGQARFSEVDALLRGARIVIEYDGWYWHQSRRKRDLDRTKTEALLAAGWSVIRIREHPLDALGIEHDQYFEIRFTNSNYRQADVDASAVELAELLTRLDG